MEDISKELEREIARSKPKPYKIDKKTQIIIVDDFGGMKSGEYLKTLVKTLSIISIVCFAAAALLYYFYANFSRDIRPIKARLVMAEKKVSALTQEKEVLMARLVISGKNPGIEKESEKEDKSIPAQVDVKKPLVSKNQEIKKIPNKPEETDTIQPFLKDEQKRNIIQPRLNSSDESSDPPLEKEVLKETNPSVEIAPSATVAKKTIDIEKFTVKKDRVNGELLVRFDIRNISTAPGGVSGRIFTVLKPDSLLEDQWLVVPGAALKDGTPSEYKKGQYFSITHFKPIKFRIKNQENPDYFKKASIFIFNEQADLIFEKLVDITESE